MLGGNKMDLEDEFRNDMIELYLEARTRCGYDAPHFQRMVFQQGGVQTARALLEDDGSQFSFIDLFRSGLLSASPETLIGRPKYASLFSNEERLLALNKAHARVG
jgi:hypothetical protein